jgi:hypothetical protein
MPKREYDQRPEQVCRKERVVQDDLRNKLQSPQGEIAGKNRHEKHGVLTLYELRRRI